MYRTPRRAAAGAAFAAATLAACAGGETPQPVDSATATAAPATASAPVANVVTFTAKDFSFDGPGEIPAGLTTFRLVDTGKELHHLQLIKLEQGKTYADLQAAIKAGGPPPTWAVSYGGVNPPVPGGGEASATQIMEPGNYAVVCFVDTPDRVPHVMKGMAAPLTVTSSPNAVMAEPTADVTMTLSDYTFTLSKPLVAGKQMIKVANAAAQPHEVALVQLEPGKTPQDIVAWIEKPVGPPPGKPLGGIPAVVSGKNTYFEVDLQPGDYGLICFVPDAKDGKPHFVHGMIQAFKI